MEKQITVTVNGKPQLAVSGLPLSQIIQGDNPCGGHGTCGKCKVIAKGNLSPLSEAERKHLTLQEQGMGIRLACLTYPLGECEIISIPPKSNMRILTEGKLAEFEITPVFSKYAVAVDIGTTTLAAVLYDTDGNILSTANAINPQQKWGADVISRIEAALDGKLRALSKTVRQALAGLLSELANSASIDAKDIDEVVITGNTVMLSLLVEQSVEPFSHAPFDVRRLFDETVTAAALELSNLLPDTPVYLPPCFSAFVGADVACAVLATGICNDDTAMMVDIGTNGEMALWHNRKLTVCATAAGPAFEGIGISKGMICADGAIDRVWIEKDKLAAHIVGDTTAAGLCGSGLVDAVACMLDLGAIDESGYLQDDEFIIYESVGIAPKDIRMLQLAKSAISAGMLSLIYDQELTPEDISKVCIAGGFGNYLNMQSAVKIGLIPKALSTVACTVGNAALSGAAMLLLCKTAKAKIRNIARNVEVMNLSTSQIFAKQYMMGMTLEERG